jgi:putative SOS response-associated peptidase YedK
MCGRFTRTPPPEEYARLFGVDTSIRLKPQYNIAPTQDILTARTNSEGKRELTLLHWGLIPSWANEPKTGYSMINARAETVASKPAFRHAFKRQRCLIAADGFYEWKQTEHGKQPYYIFLKEHKPFAFAGLWEHWEGEGHAPIESATIIVTTVNKALESIHDRMPVILPPSSHDEWLDPDVTDKERLQALLVPYLASEIDMYPVSRYVNNARNIDQRCVTPIN